MIWQEASGRRPLAQRERPLTLAVLGGSIIRRGILWGARAACRWLVPRVVGAGVPQVVGRPEARVGGDRRIDLDQAVVGEVLDDRDPVRVGDATYEIGDLAPGHEHRDVERTPGRVDQADGK